MELRAKDTVVKDILESHGVYHAKTYKQGKGFFTEAAFCSPAGEDFVFDIWHDGTIRSFSDSLSEYAREFDPEEHAEIWIPKRGTLGVPDSIRVLLDDADAIDEIPNRMYLDVSEYAYN